MSQAHEHYEILLMKAVDGELSDAERKELDGHMETCADCRAELMDFRAIKVATDDLRQRILQDAQSEPYRPGAGARSLEGLSYALMLLGALLLTGFAGVTFLMDPDVPSWVKVGASLGGLGGFGLFAYLLWLRLRSFAHDPYKEIDR